MWYAPTVIESGRIKKEKASRKRTPVPKVQPDFPSVEITIDVYGQAAVIDLADFAELLVIDPNNISEQLVRQARLYFDIAEYASCAVSAAERRKQALDIWQAEQWTEVFDSASERGAKPPTVDSAKAAVKGDPEYRKRLALWMDAQEDASLLENARDAMKMRQFMLTKLAGAQEAEGN